MCLNKGLRLTNQANEQDAFVIEVEKDYCLYKIQVAG